ncbi:MAG: hypothetical protein DWH76_00185 [Planctomycetota bacterium]|nr:MAG: hypothetical protein DWH76_00185 [Planctomycetota bacterium]
MFQADLVLSLENIMQSPAQQNATIVRLWITHPNGLDHFLDKRHAQIIEVNHVMANARHGVRGLIARRIGEKKTFNQQLDQVGWRSWIFLSVGADKLCELGCVEIWLGGHDSSD